MQFVRTTLVAAALAVAVSGCSTWDKLDQSEKGAVIGAGAGAAGGAVLSKGSALGTAAGAAVGGVVGHQVGKHKEDDDDK